MELITTIDAPDIPYGITPLEASPDGKVLAGASSSHNCIMAVWEVATGNRVLTAKCHFGITSILFPSNSIVVWLTNGHALYVSNLDTNKTILVSDRGYSNLKYQAVLSPHEDITKKMVAIGGDNLVTVWSVSDLIAATLAPEKRPDESNAKERGPLKKFKDFTEPHIRQIPEFRRLAFARENPNLVVVASQNAPHAYPHALDVISGTVRRLEYNDQLYDNLRNTCYVDIHPSNMFAVVGCEQAVVIKDRESNERVRCSLPYQPYQHPPIVRFNSEGTCFMALSGSTLRVYPIPNTFYTLWSDRQHHTAPANMRETVETIFLSCHAACSRSQSVMSLPVLPLELKLLICSHLLYLANFKSDISDQEEY